MSSAPLRDPPRHDFGDRIEIEHGLTAEDWVVVNPPDSISTGAPVRVVPARGSAAQGQEWAD